MYGCHRNNNQMIIKIKDKKINITNIITINMRV